MSQLTITRAQLTRDAIDKLVTFYNQCDTAKRQILLCLFEGKAHIVRGMEWGDFCERLLDINDGYARELLVWARVERNIFNIDPAQFLNAQPQGDLPKIQNKTARALAKLTPEKQIQAMDEGRAHYLGKRSVKEAEQDIQRIARRMLNNLPPAPVEEEPEQKEEPPTVAPSRPSEPTVQSAIPVTPAPSSTPTTRALFEGDYVQAETYDDWEEDEEEVPINENATYSIACKFVSQSGKIVNFVLPDGKPGFCILGG